MRMILETIIIIKQDSKLSYTYDDHHTAGSRFSESQSRQSLESTRMSSSLVIHSTCIQSLSNGEWTGSLTIILANWTVGSRQCDTVKLEFQNVKCKDSFLKILSFPQIVLD